MNLNLANTEPYLQFHQFLESLDRNLKVSFGALSLVKQLPANSQSTAGNRLIQLPTEGEPWGANTKWLNLDTVVTDSLLFISQMGLMQLFSAFEDFLVGSKAEFDRCETLLHQEQTKTFGGETNDPGFRKLCQAINLNGSTIENALPLYDYFEVVRNCLAHRRGRANQELVDLARSEELVVSVEQWPLRKGAVLPSLPEVIRGRQIPLLARHVICAGIVCRFLAQRINEHLVSHLGASGMVLMAAHHSLLIQEPVVRIKRRDAEAVVNEYLCGRYRVRIEQDHEVQKILKAIDQWAECRTRYKALYGEAQG